MFDVTPDDISQLNDTDLRELIGRLCEAELACLGVSPAAVTWGGNQTAADGGLDVRVDLSPDKAIDGFIPRLKTGFQVKTPDMPRSAILAEMKPTGIVRPAIQELANEAGAYIIVSSHGSTSDIALRNRRDSLREALVGAVNADQLHTDFYDRTRLATWVRRHPGLITWVKEKLGRSIIGWRPYGPWSSSTEGTEAEYLLDKKLRLDLGKRSSSPELSLVDAMDELRCELARPGKIVRLVGLSGVGKTRFVQALFDAKVGARPLASSLAVYTNLSDNPDPQPTGLASDLIANRTRAILIIDNCPPDLHRRLSDLCAIPESTLSVLTVEYDVREDQPEATQVVTLEASSLELIEALVIRRFPHLSRVDAHTIAEVSGGNARIAIALAGTVEHSETIAGLSDDELFVRLFQQRHNHSDDLLRAAQACSLVYSFQGEKLAEEDAELSRLAVLADETPSMLYRHVGELLRRDLVQQRGVWRAVLPHAIANRLAARALEDTPYDLIEQQLVTSGSERLARSLSRRLSFLHEHHQAVAIVEQWLAPGGLLGDVAALNELHQNMFENVAPVSPKATLAALERVSDSGQDVASLVWCQYHLLLRSLAYDPLLFERSAVVLAQAATRSIDEKKAKEASDTFISLFTIYLSGTHATIEQRLALIDQLLRSTKQKKRLLGLAALDKALDAWHFNSSYRFEFGAWSRDYGYQPESDEEEAQWYRATLGLIRQLALSERLLTAELLGLLAQHFREMWVRSRVLDELEGLFRDIAKDGFWREGWVACRLAVGFDNDQRAPESSARLAALEVALRPSSLLERVQAIVLSNNSGRLNLADLEFTDDNVSPLERPGEVARELGKMVATDEPVFMRLVPDLLRGGSMAWNFGNGLASASRDPRNIWSRLVDGLEQLPQKQRDVQVLRGFLAELWEHDRDIAQDLLDTALTQSVLVEFTPLLHSAVQIDERGVKRLKQALHSDLVPVSRYWSLAIGGATRQLAGTDLQDLLLLIAEQPDGFYIAVDILSMHFHSDKSAQREHAPELLKVAQELLLRIHFRKNGPHDDHTFSSIASPSLKGSEDGQIATVVAARLREAVASRQTYVSQNTKLLTTLIKAQPSSVLDALLEGGKEEQRIGIYMLNQDSGHRPYPADKISCDVLVAWCNEASKARYPLAASFISFKRRTEDNGHLWSEQAKALLTHAPNPREVLAAFVSRFRPMAWSGSRAALIESNTRLLDDLEGIIPAALMPYVSETKDRFMQEVVRERLLETAEDQARDERFE